MNIVKELRRKADLQQQELAMMVGVSRPTVSEWENQKKDPSGDRLKKLAEIFNVDELVILGALSPAAIEKAPSAEGTGLNEFILAFLQANPDKRQAVLEFLQLPEEQQLRVIGYLDRVKENGQGS